MIPKCVGCNNMVICWGCGEQLCCLGEDGHCLIEKHNIDKRKLMRFCPFCLRKHYALTKTQGGSSSLLPPSKLMNAKKKPRPINIAFDIDDTIYKIREDLKGSLKQSFRN